MQMRNIAHATSFFLYNILPVNAVWCFPFAVWRLAPSLLFHIFQVVQWAKSGLPPSVIVRQRLKLQKTKVEKLYKKCRLKILRSTQLTLPFWKVMQAPFNDHYHHQNDQHHDGQDDDKVYCAASPVPLSWWLTGCGTHFPLPTGCPPPLLPCQRTLATWFRDWVGHPENSKISLILFLGHACALPERYSTCSLYSPPSPAVDNKYDYTLEMDHADTSTVQYPRPLIVKPIH